MRLSRLWGVSAAVVTLTACVHTGSGNAEPPRPKGLVAKDGGKVEGVAESKVVEEQRPPCTSSKLTGQPPVFLKEQQIMVTRIAKPCEASDGRPGYEPDASWMAMGFPCSGGGGRLQYRDNFTNPKFVTFAIPNSCHLNPESREAASQLGVSALGLDPGAKLLAYYPMGVQYWELVDYPDADVGYIIDLRSTQSREDGWTKFRSKKDPLRVRLYGRENAWVKENRLYRAEAQLVYLGKNDFRLDVTDARALDESELEDVKKRCESLRQSRNCADIFK